MAEAQPGRKWHDMYDKYKKNITKEMDSIETLGKDFDFNDCKGGKLKSILSRLQFYAHYNKDPETIKPASNITIKILGQNITFSLEESQFSPEFGNERGRQIIIKDKSDRAPTYGDVMKIVEKFELTTEPKTLATNLLQALETPEEDQQGIEEIKEEDEYKIAMFILITHIAEAAVPFKDALPKWDDAIRKAKGKKFRSKHDPIPGQFRSGRVPMADKITRSKMRKIRDGISSFKKEFHCDNFPIRESTTKGRIWVLNDTEGKETGDLSDIEDVDEVTQRLKKTKI